MRLQRNCTQRGAAEAHHIISRNILLSKREQTGILLVAGFLSTRVKATDIGNWRKLRNTMQYFWATNNPPSCSNPMIVMSLNGGLMLPFKSKRKQCAIMGVWCRLADNTTTMDLPTKRSILRALHSQSSLRLIISCPKYFGPTTFLNNNATTSGRMSCIKMTREVSCWRRTVRDKSARERGIPESINSSSPIILTQKVWMWSTAL